jgi:hypothetical protein
MSDELYAACVEDNPQNWWKGILNKLTRFKGIRHGERIVLFRGEDMQTLEKLYGKPIEDLPAFNKWLEHLKSVPVGEIPIVLKEGQRKIIQGEANHYKIPFDVVAKRKTEMALDQFLGNY